MPILSVTGQLLPRKALSFKPTTRRNGKQAQALKHSKRSLKSRTNKMTQQKAKYLTDMKIAARLRDMF